MVHSHLVVAIIALFSRAQLSMLLFNLSQLHISSSECFVKLIIRLKESLSCRNFFSVLVIQLVMVIFEVADSLSQELDRIFKFAGVGIPVLEFLNFLKAFEVKFRH